MPTFRTVLSSGLLFLPATVAVFNQGLWVALVLWLTAISSLIYHISSEDSDFGLYDTIFACVAVFMALVSLAALIYTHGWLHWRVLSSLSLGLAAIMVYVFAANKHIDHRSEGSYHDAHMIWHILIALVALVLYARPVDHTVALQTPLSTLFTSWYPKAARSVQTHPKKR
jgi:hypothetical protein